ncbi:MAG: alpha/beta fold hydrolase [Marmoricola sp.]
MPPAPSGPASGPPPRPASPADDVVVSEELRAPVGSGFELCYQTYRPAGTETAEPLLLVMGLSAPMTWWDDALCRDLARAGFEVVRYDNRDVGRSDRGTGRVRRSDLTRAFLGRARHVPYTMSDLADDAAGLLDHLGIDRAHVVGVSMGGMIVQTLALEHPGRVASLVSIMSTTGRRSVGWQHPALFPRLLARRAASREEYVATSVLMGRAIGSPDYPEDADAARTRAGETWDRGVSASGVLRQMMAILTQPDRTRRLRALRVPAAVVHGTRDRMVHVSGGRATAAAIPDAELVLIDGMGHDLPRALHPVFVDVIRRTADRA